MKVSEVWGVYDRQEGQILSIHVLESRAMTALKKQEEYTGAKNRYFYANLATLLTWVKDEKYLQQFAN